MAHTIHKYYRGLGKHFVYCHFRNDKCKLFYIGIGTKQGSCYSTNYQRAFAKARRSPHWKNITNKTKYKVVIVFESDNLELIKEKEKELIGKYKSRLCNISPGGDYPCDKVLNKKKVYKYNLDGEFIVEYESIAEASRKTNLNTSTIHNSITKNKANNTAGFQWFYNYKGNKIKSILSGKDTKKKVRLFNEIEEHIFNSRKECAKFIKRSPGRVTDLIKIGVFNNYKIENYA